MATCLGKQFEVGKGHGQVGPCPGGGGVWGGGVAINFLEEASSLKKKRDIESHFYLDFTYSKLQKRIFKE